jgi:hypothetical protein
MARLILPAGPVFLELDDGTTVELKTYPRPAGAGVQLGLKGRADEQARVLGVSTGRPEPQGARNPRT